MNAMEEVLSFWFEESTPKQWFEKSEKFDITIAKRFKTLSEQASQGELAYWRSSIRGRLAEIIILDQFSRNLWRNTPRAFAQDGMALVLAQEAIKQPDYNMLTLSQRKFILMPFMHSESSFIHLQAVELFRMLGDDNTLDYEMRHKAIIDKFGRYPHRNGILNRPSTAEEVVFLQQPNSSF
ncbi:DUF924 family protein [Providencia rustigianii]|uniref:DUF924 domain-containing protein n=1 Tax=Providencia rustigianii DSM 4541 TaxID=500637 RepID=D1P5H8_9GAMM|nr:DUF924 family protein [Providencia rustigianii]EFB71302.1 hypothetical protein PROVRUST_07484 [Providencia rustigianii DSM 4541]SPY77947.1 Uncharacterized protein conserved in bacteria [Providencia rustigianii]